MNVFKIELKKQKNGTPKIFGLISMNGVRQVLNSEM